MVEWGLTDVNVSLYNFRLVVRGGRPDQSTPWWAGELELPPIADISEILRPVERGNLALLPT